MTAQPPPMPFHWNRSDVLLHLGATLSSGQSFRWRQDDKRIWWGVVDEFVFAVWQAEGTADAPTFWQTFPALNQAERFADYFRLNVPLEALYAEWTAREPEIEGAVQTFRGLRLLRQPPRECFFGFQCATCNTVIKIERSVQALAVRYGTPIELSFAAPFAFYEFPTLEALAEADESVLRTDLWGYRAPRVIALARHLLSKPAGWLESLRERPYSEAHAELTALHGIGAKIADCICLFCLDKDAATPVDTHIRQIAVRLFAPQLSGKSLTPKVYAEIADAYTQRFGAWAGWAQQYLFFAELRRASAFIAAKG
jgi:N-glycosylase/DNA lyase